MQYLCIYKMIDLVKGRYFRYQVSDKEKIRPGGIWSTTH